MVNKDFQLIAN